MRGKRGIDIYTCMERLFDSNNDGYISDRGAIRRKDMIPEIYFDNMDILAYILLYPKSNFIEEERLNGFMIPSVPVAQNSMYIWHFVTDSSCRNKGIMTSLLKYVKDKYNNTIYSIVDCDNISSVKVHNKLSFTNVVSFVESGCNYKMLKLE